MCWLSHVVRSPPARRSLSWIQSLLIELWFLVTEVSTLNLILLTTQTMVTTGILPLQGKFPMVGPGIETGTSWLVVRSSDHKTTRLPNLETQQWSSQHCVYCVWSVNNTVRTQSPYRPLHTIQVSVSTESVPVTVRCLEMSRFWVCVNPPATGPLLLCLSTRTWPWISECSCLLLTLNTCNRETGAATFTLRSLYPGQIISTAVLLFDSTLGEPPWRVGMSPKGDIWNLIRFVHLANRRLTEPCQRVHAIKWRLNPLDTCIYSEHASAHTGARALTHTHTHTHTHMRTLTHSHTPTQAHTHTHSHASTHAHTQTRARTHSHAHAQPHTHAYEHARTHSHAHTLTRKHTYSHARAHTHTHTQT